MRRRDFIKVVASSGIAWPLAARAQPVEQSKRIGVLMNVAADDPEGQPAVAAFQQALQQLGWSDGRNVRFDIRWGENDVDRDRKFAAELVALSWRVRSVFILAAYSRVPSPQTFRSCNRPSSNSSSISRLRVRYIEI